jgi:hypothetical protein
MSGRENGAPDADEASVPSANRLKVILRRWRRREEADDGACWHTVPAVGRALFGKAKLTPDEKEATRGLLIKLVARGEAEAFETTGRGTHYRAGGVEFAPKAIRVPGPRLFVLQRELRGEGSKPSWFDAEEFETQEGALRHLVYRQWEERARIDSRGGSGYTGEHPQRMRIVLLVAVSGAASPEPTP